MATNEINWIPKEMTFEEFVNGIHSLCEKDTLDYIDIYGYTMQSDPQLDTWVVKLVIELSKKLDINDPDWERYYIRLCSTDSNLASRLAIYELTR
jgi:hypothetical protein